VTDTAIEILSPSEKVVTFDEELLDEEGLLEAAGE
jgi:hypothetical protein